MDGTNEAAFQSFLGAEQFGGHHPFLCLLHADEAWQEPAASASMKAMPRLLKTETDAGGARHQADVHGQAHGDADADGRTVDRSHDRLQAVEDRERDQIAGLALLRGIAIIPDLEGAGAAGDIRTGAKGPAGARHDDGAHLIHRIHTLEEVDEFPAHDRGKSVQLVRGG